jgi:tRNA (cytidine/uridine-2'-O-)-methyltransferase
VKRRAAARFRVVLVEPEIPWNTGNVGRTCIGADAELHLAGKLGFSLEDRHLKRAGLDYWPNVRLFVHPDANVFFGGIDPRRTFFLSARAKKNFWKEKIPAGATLVFGRETTGLPAWLRRRYPRRFFRLPLAGPIRSLNLSTAVGMALGEAIRQQGLGTRG